MVVLYCIAVFPPLFTVKKLECSKRAFAMNTLAWNNRIGPDPVLLVCLYHKFQRETIPLFTKNKFKWYPGSS